MKINYNSPLHPLELGVKHPLGTWFTTLRYNGQITKMFSGKIKGKKFDCHRGDECNRILECHWSTTSCISGCLWVDLALHINTPNNQAPSKILNSLGSYFPHGKSK